MIIRIKVHPFSKKEEFLELEEGNYEFWTKKKAEKGLVNIELLKVLSRKFKIHSSKIKIKNSRSRTKLVEILDK